MIARKLFTLSGVISILALSAIVELSHLKKALAEQSSNNILSLSVNSQRTDAFKMQKKESLLMANRYGGSVYSYGNGNLLLSVPIRTRNIVKDLNGFFYVNQKLRIPNKSPFEFYIQSMNIASIRENHFGISVIWKSTIASGNDNISCIYRGNDRSEWKFLCPLPAIARNSLGKGYIPTR